MEDDAAKINLNYFVKSIKSKLPEILNDAKWIIEGSHYEEVVERIVAVYKNVFKCSDSLKVSKLYFDTPRTYAQSTKVLFKMMNRLVPDRDNVTFKEVVFDYFDGWMVRVKDVSKDPIHPRVYLFLEQYFKFKAAYTLIELEQFFRIVDINSLTSQEMMDIGMVYGGAISSLVHIENFSLEHNILSYHRLGQAAIQKIKADKYNWDYREAIRKALIKWKIEKDDCDHIEMATYLMGLNEFAHLDKDKLQKKLVPIAKTYNRARGVNGYKKIKDE